MPPDRGRGATGEGAAGAGDTESVVPDGAGLASSSAASGAVDSSFIGRLRPLLQSGPLAGTARTAASATSFRLRNKKQDRCQRGRVCPLRFNSFSRSVILIDGGDGEQSQHEPMAPVFKLPLLLKEFSGSV
jgi:hypothetical protein